MENVPHDQTPMSSKLTTMLLFLRDDHLVRCDFLRKLPQCIVVWLFSDRHLWNDFFLKSKIDGASPEQDYKPETCDIESDGITLGGDVCNCRKSKCLKL